MAVFSFFLVLPLLLAFIQGVMARVQLEGDSGLLFIKDLLVNLTPLTSWDCYSIGCYFPSYFMMNLFCGRCYKKLDRGLTQFASIYASELHGLVGNGTEFTCSEIPLNYLSVVTKDFQRLLFHLLRGHLRGVQISTIHDSETSLSLICGWGEFHCVCTWHPVAFCASR